MTHQNQKKNNFVKKKKKKKFVKKKKKKRVFIVNCGTYRNDISSYMNNK